MGRKKLKIMKLESMKARQVKYSKRKVGILKKAKELATLCDVDLAIVMISPTGKPALHVGHDKDLVTVLEKLAKLSIEDREQRRAYTMDLLKKIYSKSNAEVDLGNSSPERDHEAIKLQRGQLGELQQRLIEKRKILRDWKCPYVVDNLAQIKLMEEHLMSTLDRISDRKIDLWDKEKGLEGSQEADALQSENV